MYQAQSVPGPYAEHARSRMGLDKNRHIDVLMEKGLKSLDCLNLLITPACQHSGAKSKEKAAGSMSRFPPCPQISSVLVLPYLAGT